MLDYSRPDWEEGVYLDNNGSIICWNLLEFNGISQKNDFISQIDSFYDIC